MPGETANWRALLDEIGVRPSKALGQNFLHDRNIVRRIAEAAELGPDDLVLEVGPGLGILTRELAARAGEVIAVELDRRLAGYLRQADLPPNVEVVQADVLTVDPAELTGGRPYAVVANLPYSVATAAITHLLQQPHRPRRMVVMVQREVAERMVARPPEMSVLAVAVQLFSRPRIVFRVGPGAFIPPPKIESAVVRLEVAGAPPLAEADLPGFFALARAGFGQRRKRLGNALAAGPRQPKGAVEAALEEAGVDPDRRAETLTVEEWIAVYRAMRRSGLLDG